LARWREAIWNPWQDDFHHQNTRKPVAMDSSKFGFKGPGFKSCRTSPDSGVVVNRVVGKSWGCDFDDDVGAGVWGALDNFFGGRDCIGFTITGHRDYLVRGRITILFTV
jgi:hypothetical protein